MLIIGLEREKPRPTRRQLVLAAWATAIGSLLPGDHIHTQAPISRKKGSLEAAVAAIDAAQAKRDRKRAARAKRG